jgi:hypothetical protein
VDGGVGLVALTVPFLARGGGFVKALFGRAKSGVGFVKSGFAKGEPALAFGEIGANAAHAARRAILSDGAFRGAPTGAVEGSFRAVPINS